MHLVYDQEPDTIRDRQQDSFDKSFIGEPLWRNQHRVYPISQNLPLDDIPILGIGGIDCLGSNPKTIGRFDLVAH